MTQTTELHDTRRTGANLMDAVRGKWGWFVALGLLFILLGVVALGNLLAATVATVFYIGAVIAVAGIFQILHAFANKNWGAFFLWLLAGLCYAVAGVMIVMNPTLASVGLTLMFAVLTIVSGLMRLVVGFKARGENGTGWFIASAVLTTIAGVIFLLGWPVNSLWLLGLLLAIDLIFQGVSLVALGWQLRSREMM